MSTQRIPYILWHYWFKSGLEKPDTHNYEKVNYKTLKIREKRRRFINSIKKSTSLLLKKGGINNEK